MASWTDPIERLRQAFSKPRTRFAQRYLDPTDRLEEILCGLIMVLDFTLIGGLTAGVGKQGVRHLLIAALGCNVAWGIIECVVRGGQPDRPPPASAFP